MTRDAELVELVDRVLAGEREVMGDPAGPVRVHPSGITHVRRLGGGAALVVGTASSAGSSTTFEIGPVAEPVTEVIPAVAPALVDPVPPGPAGAGRRARTPRPLWRALVNAGSLGVLLSAAFLAGQWTTQNGVAPVLPLPASDVHTAAATARLWALNTPAEQQQTCGYLATLGDTRDIVLAQWVGHLQSQVGGQLDEVNRGVVAGVLDDACAGRAPDARKG